MPFIVSWYNSGCIFYFIVIAMVRLEWPDGVLD
jgi:hypothetical protein